MVYVEGEAYGLNREMRCEPVDSKTSGPQRVGSNQSPLPYSHQASDQRI